MNDKGLSSSNEFVRMIKAASAVFFLKKFGTNWRAETLVIVGNTMREVRNESKILLPR